MDEENGGTSRRRITRRGRSGFAFSNNSIGNSTEGGDVADDPNDEAEELIARQPLRPSPLNRGAGTPLQMLPNPAINPATGGQAPDDYNPASRLEQVRQRATGYEREYRLDLVGRLLRRRVPLDEIATQLQVSMPTVNRDIAELKSRMRDRARKLDIDDIIGDSSEFYDEVSALALRAASNNEAPLAVRLAGARTALAARNDMHRFYQTAGVYDVLRFRAANSKGQSDVSRLMTTMERLLNGEGDGFSNTPDSGDQEDIDL